MGRHLVGTALFAAVALFAAPVHAYVLTRSAAGSPVRWPTSCVVLAPDARGDTSADTLDGDAIEATLRRATDNWNARLKGCSFMSLGVVSATRALEAVSDGRPSLVFRADRWGRADKDYDPNAIAVTTVWFADRGNDPTDGQISDADIEVNAVDYTLTNDPAHAVLRPGTIKIADLENTLTHELGHVLGLAHTCWDHKTTTPPIDDTGAPVPDCDSPNLSAKIRNATMFPYADDRSVSMRVVGDDDLRGVCDSYPLSGPAPACYGFIEGSGCGYVPVVSRAALPGRLLVVGAALLAALLAVGVARRRRRRRGIL